MWPSVRSPSAQSGLSEELQARPQLPGCCELPGRSPGLCQLSGEAVGITTIGSYSAEPVRERSTGLREQGQERGLNPTAWGGTPLEHLKIQTSRPCPRVLTDLGCGTRDSFSTTPCTPAPSVPLRCRQGESPKDRGWKERLGLPLKVPMGCSEETLFLSAGPGRGGYQGLGSWKSLLLSGSPFLHL